MKMLFISLPVSHDANFERGAAQGKGMRKAVRNNTAKPHCLSECVCVFIGKLSQEKQQRSGHGKQEIDSVLTGTEGQGLKVLEGMYADMPGDSDFRLCYGLCVCVCTWTREC